MLRTVVDTNIFISGTIKKDSPPDKVLRAWRKRKFILVISKQILEEIHQVLNYQKIRAKYHLTKANISYLLSGLYLISEITYDKIKVNLITQDPQDNKFLACALEGHADYIVTGDKHLLEIKEYKNIKIITATNFLKILKHS